MIFELIAREKCKPEVEFQAGTSCSYNALYKYENIKYVEVPGDHLYNKYDINIVMHECGRTLCAV